MLYEATGSSGVQMRFVVMEMEAANVGEERAKKLLSPARDKG